MCEKTRKMKKYRIIKCVKPVKNVQEQESDDHCSLDEDLVICSEPDVPALNATDAEDEKVDVEVANDQVVEERRYPQRERRPPAYLADYVSAVENEDDIHSYVDYCYRVSNFPNNYKEAIESPQCDQWKTAMEEEMKCLKENNTFTITALPEGRKAVGADGCLL